MSLRTALRAVGRALQVAALAGALALTPTTPAGAEPAGCAVGAVRVDPGPRPTHTPPPAAPDRPLWPVGLGVVIAAAVLVILAGVLSAPLIAGPGWRHHRRSNPVRRH